LRDSNLTIIGFLIIVLGWAFQTAAGIGGGTGNAGTILQLAGTLGIVIGTVLLAIGFFKFVRRVEKHIYSQSR
jgi:hypothetical protein